MESIAVAIPDESTVLAAAEQAAAAGLHLICNGKRSCISPIVPAGWFKVAVKIKPTQETAPCHA